MNEWPIQSSNQPLYPNIVWSRPENKNGSGKLLIIGGNSTSFSNVAKEFSDAEKAGVGICHVLVPASLSKITKDIPFIEYAPANPSGSFSRKALAEILGVLKITDGLLIAGDLGKNSETSLLLEDLLAKFSGPVFISSNALASFASISFILNREKTVLFVDKKQLRDIFIEAKSTFAITSELPKAKLAEALIHFSSSHQSTLVVQDFNNVWVAHSRKIIESEKSGVSAAKTAVWTIQQPEKWLEVITTSLN